MKSTAVKRLDSILGSIAEITGQRKEELLKKNLVKTISSLIPSSETTLYNMIGNDKTALNNNC